MTNLPMPDLLEERDAPPNRLKYCPQGEREKHFTEAAVMVAFAMHLFRENKSIKTVKICPDGEHAKRFDILKWMTTNGFVRAEPLGSTAYGGKYTRDDQTLVISPTSGLGDIVVEGQGNLIAECKGGIINTRHPGQASKLRKGLCETVGQLMTNQGHGRQIAVVPFSPTTLRTAERMIDRTKKIGIEIALAHADGRIEFVAGK
jgi:hypothetical protein